MISFHSNYPLRALNTFAIDAVACHYVEFSTQQQIAEIFERVARENYKWWPLGGGSNIIFTGAFDGVVIRCVADNIVSQNGLVVADAGVKWDDLVEWCVRRGYGGLENLSDIPGTVGASPVQNIGAYGVEAGERIEWVEYFDSLSGEVRRISGDRCAFGYRDSIFKNELNGRAFVLSVAYRVDEKFEPSTAKLGYGDLEARVQASGELTLESVRRAVIDIRRSKLPQPDVEPNAGSFFKNPVVDARVADELLHLHPSMTVYPLPDGRVKIPAGWLIDKAGWKGYRRGPVGVHPLQALVIVNYDSGSADDILALAGDIKADIAAKFGVEISMEVGVL